MSNPSISNGAFLNTDEAAAMLGVHPKTLQRLARTGRVTAYRVGKLWRFQGPGLVCRCCCTSHTSERTIRSCRSDQHLNLRWFRELWVRPADTALGKFLLVRSLENEVRLDPSG